MFIYLIDINDLYQVSQEPIQSLTASKRATIFKSMYQVSQEPIQSLTQTELEKVRGEVLEVSG